MKEFIADSLINTRAVPPGRREFMDMALESRAYWDMNPYPFFGFQNWKTEELGQYPRCLPIPYAIIRRSAIWLFGKPIQIHINGAKEVEEDIRKHWKRNKFDQKLVTLAEQGGTDGEVVLKFSYDESNQSKPLRFQILSSVQQVHFFYHPLDSEQLLMVRIQFPFFDPDSKSWFWYREEWTDTTEVHYKPLQILSFGLNPKNPYYYSGNPTFPEVDTTTSWEIESQEPNKFGIIPVCKIKNIDSGGIYGRGDLFKLTRVIDRINLTYYLMDRSNQLDIDPVLVFIDLQPKEGDNVDSPRMPGGAIDLESIPSEEGKEKQGKVQVLEHQGKMREHLLNYANELKEMVYDATGSVFPRQDAVTNKGSLTQSVMAQIYSPLLEVTREKRKGYGDEGISPFIRKIIIGLKNLGIAPYDKLKIDNDLENEEIAVTFTWFNQFESTPDEKFGDFDRLDRENAGGYLPTAVIVRKVAELEEIKLTEEDIEKQVGIVDERTTKILESGGGNNSTSQKRGNDPGGNEDGQIKDGEERKSRSQKRGFRTKDAT